MKIPTIIMIGAVAAAGTRVTSGVINIQKAKHMAVTTVVSPVFPPASIPAKDSTKVLIFDVPIIAPVVVAVASAINAFSLLVEKSLLLDVAFFISVSLISQYLMLLIYMYL